MHFPHEHRSSYCTSYRTQDWKLVYDYNPGGKGVAKHELYNLKADPFENDNLVSKSPEKFDQMIAAMVRQLKAENALYPVDGDGEELLPKIH